MANVTVEKENEPLTDDERKELEELRASKKNAPDKAADEKEEVPLPDTHWLNLADGTTITSKGGGISHVNGVPVLHSTEIPAELLEGGNPNAEPVHRF
jgi:hypothetical protein